MDEREAALLESELRHSLTTLDRIAVPSLAAVRSRRSSIAGRGLGVMRALAVTALVLVVALVVGDRLTAFRNEHVAGPSGAIALDDRYGFLVPDQSAARLTLTDEHGRALAAPIDNVAATRTSPDGRSVAVWQTTPDGSELWILDGATRALRGPLLTTPEPLISGGLVWASDSSGIVATTVTETVNRQPSRAKVWLVTLSDASHTVLTYDGTGVRPLFWQRPAGLIGLSALSSAARALPRYSVMREDGSFARDDTVSEAPIAADDTGTYLVTSASCQPAPCRTYEIRSAATYDSVAQIPVPATTNVSGLWFRPRSSDVLVLFGSETSGGNISGDLFLYPNAGRGAPRRLDSVSDHYGPSLSFWVSTRADGSATFFGLTSADNTVKGDLVAIDSGDHAPVQIRRPVATIILSSAVQASPPLSACAGPNADPAKCQTPPPGYTPYSPSCDLPLATADDIRAAAAAMGAMPGETPPPGGASQFGDPLLVHGLLASDPDEWLVPRSDGRGGASAVTAVGIRANGRGCAGMSQGWSGPFPRISLQAARIRAAGPNDPVALIEPLYFPWTNGLPPSSNADLVWRVVRQSGHEIFLFDSGDLYEGWWIRAYFAGRPGMTALRGDPPGATPRPPLANPIRYPVSNADEVLAGARTDTFVVQYLRYLRSENGEPHTPVAAPALTTPVHVIGLHKPYTVDVWIVPIVDASGAVVSLITVPVGNDGLGNATEARAWSGSFPKLSATEAERIGSTGNDPATSAQLGWADELYASPGGPTSASWLVTRRSGGAVVVTEDGAVVAVPK